jgi:N-acetyl-anhydromuramyl-L-alanine amidase AmpD
MALHRTRVGLHARNDVRFQEHDYEMIRQARIETLKMMSFTDVGVFQRLRSENPDIEFIVRLYDDRFNRDSRPSPSQFLTRMVPIINRLGPYATKFEIHNEPNHVDGIEGWGPSDSNARSFRAWYLQVLETLQKSFPWARFGFPGLALNYPHRDLPWLDICRDAVLASGWLGCHCYWQYGNMLSINWGLRCERYHERFPDMPIEITEFGNSTPNLPREEMARQYARYYKELNRFPYLGSASSFIASSPDPAWAPFVWMKEGGERMPVVDAVANMERKPVDIPPAPKPAPESSRTFPQTGKTVRGAFLAFYDKYGPDICGYPITEQFEEEGQQTQYFQRLALAEAKPGKIELKLVGSEAWSSRSQIAQLQARVEELSQLLLAYGPAIPPIKDIVDELPTHSTKHYEARSLAEIRYLVIHHTATAASITPQRLAEYQVHRQGKPGIAYHFCIAADGTIYQTQRLDTATQHAAERSRSSINICFPGNFTSAIPTSAQLEAGGRLCAWLVGGLRLPTSAIVGITEFADTQSPGKQWLTGARWKDKLLEKVKSAMKASGGEQAALISSLQDRLRALSTESQSFGLESVPQPSGPGPAAISQPPIRDLIETLPHHSTKKYRTRSLDDIEYLVIHHSAVPPAAGPRRIAQYHVTRQDWPGIGYHFLVGADGTLYQGNALETVSNHAANMNTPAVGICFLGNFMKEVPPEAQIQAGAHLTAWLMQELGVPLDKVRGHKEFMDTACPGIQWLSGKKWKEMLFEEIAAVLEKATPPSPEPPPDEKPIYHYMLFWASGERWAETDWINARDYIRTFRPTAGFSAKDAALAKFVTIVGGPLGIPRSTEDQLKQAGCQVDRIAGRDEAETKQILDRLVQQGKRFQSFDG